MKRLLLIIAIFSVSFINAFSLKDKIINGKNGDYVVTEQGGTSSVLIIRSLSSTHLILEEIDVPSLNRKPSEGSWKEWVAQDAPGHTAWTLYIVDLKTNKLQECYSHTDGVWLSTQDPQHFLPRLLTLSLQKTAQEERKRIGPPPGSGDEDRRSIWNPAVVIDGQKLDKPVITAWNTRWPQDGSIIAGCEIELYFSSAAFPVWIEVRSPHYKASLRAIDSGTGINSPRPIVFQQSPLILGSSALKENHMELFLHCPTYYNSLKVYAVDLSDPRRPLIKLSQVDTVEKDQTTLQIPQQILQSNLIKGHRYRWVVIPAPFRSMVIYSDQIFEW